MSSTRCRARCAARARQRARSSSGAGSAILDAHVYVDAARFIDDIVVEEGTSTGTHDGVLPGPTGDMPPTGRSVEVAYIQVLRFRDGKHVSFNLMFDWLRCSNSSDWSRRLPRK